MGSRISKGFTKVKININGCITEGILPDTASAKKEWKELIVE